MGSSVASHPLSDFWQYGQVTVSSSSPDSGVYTNPALASCTQAQHPNMNTNGGRDKRFSRLEASPSSCGATTA
jgi:hypothetical protein